MPIIKQRPSINEDWLKAYKISKEDLIKGHPLADKDYLSDEWDRIMGKDAEAKEEEAAPARIKK